VPLGLSMTSRSERALGKGILPTPLFALIKGSRFA
jgi:hypothetical protein